MSEGAAAPRQQIAVAVVRRGDEYLIGQRPPGVPLAGLWEFPGGKVHSGETPAQAAVRECREETGVDVTIIDALALVRHAYPHGELEIHYYACEPAACSAAAPHGAAAPRGGFQWTLAARLAQCEFPAANAQIIAGIVARHERRPTP